MEHATMRITCGPDRRCEDAMFARAAGAFDFTGAKQAREILPGRLTRDRPSLLVDMSEVDWMTSAGVGALIDVLNQAETLGGKLCLFGCNKKVCRVLEVCELESLFNVCADADKARERLH